MYFHTAAMPPHPSYKNAEKKQHARPLIPYAPIVIITSF
jgi:hypothetical protein